MNKDWQKDKVLAMADNRIINYSGKTLCANYRNPLGRCKTPEQAIRLYKNCISWALQERYPTKSELLSFTSKEILAENGVYIDMDFNGERIYDHICCVFLNCRGWIRTGLNVEKAIIPMLYLSDGSNIKVKVDENIPSVPVELYYGSRIGGNLKKLTIKNCNGLTAKDNVGFSDKALAVDPDMGNEHL